ncbi:hypothetical protein CLU79DRAFT_761308, partial [Phycomyces nitens]
MADPRVSLFLFLFNFSLFYFITFYYFLFYTLSFYISFVNPFSLSCRIAPFCTSLVYFPYFFVLPLSLLCYSIFFY